MRRPVLHRASARLLLAALVAQLLGVAAYAVLQAHGRLEIARNYRHEPFDAAQDRLIGHDYMQSVRAIRAEVPVSETVYLIDEEDLVSGATYFALHYLAPRRVVFLGAPARGSNKLVLRRLPDDAKWVVVVHGFDDRLELVAADSVRALRGRRAR